MVKLQLSKLAEILTQAGFPTSLEGEDRGVCGVNTLSDARDGEITFLSNPRYVASVKETAASAVIARPGVEIPKTLSVLRCDDPYGAVTVAIITLHGHRRNPRWGLNPQASIDASAKIGANPNIAAGITIAADVVVGDNCTIYPGCYLADGVRIGNDCTLFPNVVIYNRCELGDRVTIHAGSVIGEDGLGYAPNGDKWVKIPQVGRAVIGDDVEIGANCTIDRATLGQTEIGAGTKFGNVVVIGHGTKIGPDCMFVGLVGVAGSVTVGRHVTLAGQVGVAGHLAIGDGAMVGAQSGIAGDVEAKASVFGSPAIPMENAKRSMYVFQKLPDWVRRIKDLEREVRDLREKLNGQVDAVEPLDS
ncbi:MAG: UDP-3-O-(3-hydroxymyristoyl)glucosamine N-acyltransferase [Planctomycetota bacterium]